MGRSLVRCNVPTPPIDDLPSAALLSTTPRVGRRRHLHNPGGARRERAVFWRYVAAVAFTYAASFTALLTFHGPPVGGLVETVAAVVGGSAVMAFLVTIRAMDLTPEGRSRFSLPSAVHVTVLLALLIVLLTT